jgi:hypothetical protein
MLVVNKLNSSVKIHQQPNWSEVKETEILKCCLQFTEDTIRTKQGSEPTYADNKHDRDPIDLGN